MAEHLTVHRFIIDKVIHNGKVTRLQVRQKKWPYKVRLEYILKEPQPKILHNNPEWLKELVDHLNKKEVKFIL